MANPKEWGSIRELYRIGYGPSSSHTMGPRRAAEIFRRRTPDAPGYRVTLYGSLAAVGRGHLTDRVIAEALAPASCEIVWDEDAPYRHPNAVRFEALDRGGTVRESWVAFSVGGGRLEDEGGPIPDGPEVSYPVGNITDCLRWCQAQRKPFWALAAECEPGLWDYLAEVWRVMEGALRRGLESEQCLLPGGLDVPRKAESAYARAQNLGGVMREQSLISAYALAVAEENASGGLVVTAPTCGSAGILPAILHYFSTSQDASEQQVLRGLATAALFGMSVKANASISGAEVGCQGEVGTACAMAAAAATQLLGGSPAQIEYAAEMALEHHLGLTCDPVMGLVQVPCIERNAIAAMRALACATYALLSDGRHIIPFDVVVEVMYETGRDLQSAYRETAAGGLAEVWRRRREQMQRGGPAD